MERGRASFLLLTSQKYHSQLDEQLSDEGWNNKSPFRLSLEREKFSPAHGSPFIEAKYFTQPAERDTQNFNCACKILVERHNYFQLGEIKSKAVLQLKNCVVGGSEYYARASDFTTPSNESRKNQEASSWK